MPTVDAFESSTPEQKLSEDAQGKFDYAQVEEVLKHVDVGGLEMAENVYARCAKRHFSKLVVGDVHLSVDALPKHQTLFITSMELVMPGDSIQTSRLSDLTRAMADTITTLRWGEPIIFDGPLRVRVTEVGMGVFKFSLKQHWVIR